LWAFRGSSSVIVLRFANRFGIRQAAGIAERDERIRTVDAHALLHTFAPLLSKGSVSPRTAQAAMRHSKIDLTMNVYTDPKLLDVHGALDALPTLALNASPQTEAQAMRATGKDGRGSGVASNHAQSFVAPDVAPTTGKLGLFESFPVTLDSMYDGQIQSSETAQTGANIKKASFAAKRMRLQRGG
jgi:hypothetical protein